MIHPDTELRFIDDVIGHGVVATAMIPKGTIVWCQDELDQVIPADRVERMSDPYRDVIDKYAFRDKQGDYVLCWDNGRFVNHSFRPNCLPTPYDLELAVRDILPGEELLDHYGALNLLSPFRALPEPGVRRRVAYPDDLPRHHRSWDRQLRDAFEGFDKVGQPLWPFVADRLKPLIRAVVEAREPMGSCLETWCPVAAPALQGSS
jgi:hypothetical protein